MQEKEVKRHRIRWSLAIASALALLLAGLELTEQEASEDAAAGESEPALVEHLAGTKLSRVTLSASAAERLGLQTAPVRLRTVTLEGQRTLRKVVPYSAVLYDEHGKTWVYTSPRRLTFVRAPVVIEAISGDLAVLSAGPREGTAVAAVGAAELYGTEFEVDH